jgi:predicted dehydrogenase
VGAADETAVSDAFRDHFELPRLQVDEVLQDKEIDAVLIHSGSAQMADLAAAALRAGKSVLVEKPGGQNVADLRRVVDAEKASRGVCQVGYTTIASQGITRGREILDSGALGRVLQVRVDGSCAEGEAGSDFLNAPGEMGGPLWIIGSHAIHVVLELFGLPRSVNARILDLGRAISPRCAEDAAAVILTYPDKLISVDFSSWEPLPWVEGNQFEVYGTEGVLRVEYLPAQTHLFLRECAGGLPAGWTDWRATSFPTPWTAQPTAYSPELAEVANEELFDREIEAFLGAIHGANDVLCSARDALAVAEVIAGCFASAAAAGTEVELP